MYNFIYDLASKLLTFRKRFWELDCSQPFWLWLGIRWCISWLSRHGDLEDE